ncbi:MAG: tRNA (N6-isopentenyl adenosine(37)-C2)-methylthiotransferase MiaB [Tissierellia bacterium]|nr:tRNA (N6-isopentenyl adenosine(37)-C2)-methylthiotransferase MiaB [Tissierellia bacterium]
MEKEIKEETHDEYFSYITALQQEIKDQNYKYHIMTYGCQMNEHDSEKIAWICEESGYYPTENPEDADLVLLNTCSIRHSAEDKVYGKLGELKNLKRKKHDFKLAVCGCMMQRKESRQFVLDKFPHVDIIFGTNNIYKLPELLLKNLKTNDKEMDIIHSYENTDNSLVAKRIYHYKAFVNIMYGCNNFCTYCVVPYTRGRENSRKLEDIVQEVKNLVANGVVEITLLGQNVNSYGKNLNPRVTFTDLLREINKIEGLERIRFMTSHPKDISEELIYAFRDLDKLCNFLHLPVQAGSNDVLNKMNRKYTREDYLKKIKRVKEINPNIALSTDLMVGFPGETEENFQDTLDLVKEVEYDNSFTFLYSKREGTIAARSENQVEDDVKHERFERLLKVLYPIQRKKNEAFIGRVVNVLAEQVSKNNDQVISGRTEEFKLVNFPGTKEDIGKIIPIKIRDANSFVLTGDKYHEKS